MNKTINRFFQVFFLMIAFAFSSWSQIKEIVISPKETRLSNPPLTQYQSACGTDKIHQKMMASDPLYVQRVKAFNNQVLSQGKLSSRSATIYKIPVVVHVMSDNGSLTQISEQQVREAIQNINERYRKIMGTLGDGNGVDAEIEFALAVRDPAGNCTNGITYTDMSAYPSYMNYGVNADNSDGMDDPDLKNIIRWNPSQYYNIWLVSEIDNNNGGYGIQGYAYFPSAHGMSIDGTVVLVNAFKSKTNTTMVHELGHALGLYHTFQGDEEGTSCPPSGANQGDFCGDTPPHIRSASNCEPGTNSCDGGSSNTLFIHNYMDYSSESCQNEFTADQKTRMVTAISTTRKSFLSSEGNLSLVPPLPPSVDFTSSSSLQCTGETVTLYDLSSCIPNTFLGETDWDGISFSWTVTDGTNVYTSTKQNPSFALTNQGVYDVTLSVTNTEGTNSLTKNNFFVVVDPAKAACEPAPSYNPPANYGYTVSNVMLNNLNSTTSTTMNGDYIDYSCERNTIVEAGATYPLSVTINSGAFGTNVENVAVYIDYNDNGTFEPDELVLSGVGEQNTNKTLTENITIPLTAVKDKMLRMRVFGDYVAITSNNVECLTYLVVGDIEDYGVFISEPCSPVAQPVISVTNACGSSTLTASDYTGALLWSTGESTTSITVTSAGNYSVTQTVDGCTSSAATATAAPKVTPPAPTIDVTNACGSSTLTASGYTGALSWSTGESTTSITVTSAGNYSVTQTVDGCTSSAATATAAPKVTPPAPTIDVTNACGNSTLTASGYTGTLSWSTGESIPLITVTSAGNYSVTQTVDGCISSAASATAAPKVTPPAPTIDVANACGNSTLTASGYTGALSWSTGESIPLITVTSAGNYSVTQTVDGCISSAATATAAPKVTPPAPTIDVANACGSSTLTASDYTGALLWSTGESIPLITVTSAGNYSVTQTVDGCISSAATATAAPKVTPPAPTIDVANACGSSTLTASDYTGALLWSTGESTTSITVTSAGTYSVTVTDLNECETSESVIIEEIEALAAGDLVYSLDANCAFYFSIENVTNVDTFTWDFGDGTTMTTTTAFTAHTFAEKGNYLVTVVLSNECETITKQITVICDDLGIDEAIANHGLGLYPNPASSKITIENSSKLHIEKVMIIDNLGRIVDQKIPLSTEDYQFDVTHFSNGIFIIKIITDKGIITKKFEVLK